MKYEELLKEADDYGLLVKEKSLKAHRGRIKGNRIAIKENLYNNVVKACILVEELGHYHTTVGDILDQSDINNRKQERKARAWGYERLISVLDIINAYKNNITNRYELSEYLNVTEEFIDEAIEHYYKKHGYYCRVGKYVVYFNPLAVMEIWE